MRDPAGHRHRARGLPRYNLLFVEPRNTFAVAAPEELLNLLLLLFVGVVIGRLAGNQRDCERVAQRREREGADVPYHLRGD
jgi:K+-sensing histidine kinase KdpD